jgi:formylglycine-generating enzyme required for sulfatase activity
MADSPNPRRSHLPNPPPGFTLLEKLGSGGFGEVWKAQGPGGFAVALKFIRLGDKAGTVELRALEVMKDIRHPHLLVMFGAWQQEDLLIIAMELADGTLTDRLATAQRQGLLGVPLQELLEYMRDAARGIDHLNAIHIQHRDIKPQNLLLVGGGVKVGDFGLAKLLQHTLTGHSGAYTPAYVAPEFLSGHTSSHSDQYALAVSYCQLRGGRLPFEGPITQVLTGHALHPPDLTMLPAAERPAAARALAKEPKERWGSCREFVQALASATAGLQRGQPRAESRPVAPALPLPGPLDFAPGGSIPAGSPGVVPALRLLPVKDVVLLCGEGRGVQVQLERDECPGAEVLKLEGLPDGVRAAAATVPAGSNLGRLTLQAAADAAPRTRRVRLTATAGRVQAEGQFEVAVPREVVNSVGMHLALIPRGTFRMGSPDTDGDALYNEKPRHGVEITRPFYVGVHPVTVRQFRQFAEDTQLPLPWLSTGGGPTDDHPVVRVPWVSAAAFCEWLGKKEGRTYELPTEAEWEYACRAGATTRYHFGDDPARLGDYAWYRQNAGGQAHKVGGKKPNAWGLFDMHGNIWQWCLDGPRRYETESVKDPIGPLEEGERVLRGGSWDEGARRCRAAFRYGLELGIHNNDIGFRVVLRPGPRTPSPDRGA